MEVAWLYNSSFSEIGGAELTITNRIKTGRKRGHNIIKISKDTKNLLHNNYDLYILSDTKYSYSSKLINSLHPSVRILHNHHFCIYDTFLCQNFDYPSKMPLFKKVGFIICLLKPQCYNINEDVDLYVFHSPLQKQVTERFFGREFKNGVVITSSIDTSAFFDKKEDRLGACAINSTAWIKGINNVKKWCRENKEELTLIKNIPHIKMNNVYNKHEFFIHLPNWYEPSGRMVFEAALAGCKVITNNRVGATSFNWWGTEKMRDELKKSKDEFWAILERKFK
jgi:glycosyltransferase involved in cell wall biosynthesis